ncbi:hypothetical protein MSSD1_385 [Mycoplasmopsis synoviae]
MRLTCEFEILYSNFCCEFANLLSFVSVLNFKSVQKNASNL